MTNIPFPEYLADRTSVSKHWLDLINRSPGHLKWFLDHPEFADDTPALRFGRYFHHLLLEPDTVDDAYIMEPEGIDRRTKIGKAAYADFLELAEGKTAISPEEYEIAKGMAKSVRNHSKASAILRIGEAEQTIFWRDEGTSEKCKARADFLHGTESSLIVDIKTTFDARPEKFARDVMNYRYDVQAAHYELGFDLRRFVFIVVEKKPPFGVIVYAADQDILNRGMWFRDRNLNTYSECNTTGVWPLYDDEIITIDLPPWARIHEYQ